MLCQAPQAVEAVEDWLKQPSQFRRAQYGTFMWVAKVARTLIMQSVPLGDLMVVGRLLPGVTVQAGGGAAMYALPPLISLLALWWRVEEEADPKM